MAPGQVRRCGNFLTGGSGAGFGEAGETVRARCEGEHAILELVEPLVGDANQDFLRLAIIGINASPKSRARGMPISRGSMAVA